MQSMMTRQKKRAGAVILPLILGLTLAACSGDNPETADGADADLTVGFAQQSSSVAYRINQSDSVREEAASRGYGFAYTDAQDDTAKQVSDVEDLVAQGVDYLILSPREFDGLEAGISAAREADIPVILIDRLAAGEVGTDYVTSIRPDTVWEGEAAGEWIVDNAGPDANIVELTGTPGASAARDRSEGFHNAIAARDDLNVLATQTAEFSRADAQEVMDNLLGAHRDAIDVVYAHNDEMALGAALSIQAAGLTPGEDVLIVGIDGQIEAFEAIRDGSMSATVFSSPYYGPAVFDVIDELVAGESVEEEIILPGFVVDAENVEDEFDQAY